MKQSRGVLVAIFVVGLGIQLLSFVFSRHKMWSDELRDIIGTTLAVYSPHLGVILGGVFSHHQDFGRRRISTQATWTALVVAFGWNLLMVWPAVSYLLTSSGDIAEVKEYIQTVGPSGSFLVGAALVYFFTSR